MSILIIARHGNTFEKDETPRRVGLKTDLPLVESGRAQARALGVWLKRSSLYPEAVYTSELRRTQETARIALDEAGYKEPVYPLAIFNEVDYGPDENQPESAVINRIGEDALKAWDTDGTVPPGWNFDPEKTIEDWKNFAAHLVQDRQGCTLVVTSNGIARFAPHIADDFESFLMEHTLKLSTGALAVFEYAGGGWKLCGWNIRP